MPDDQGGFVTLEWIKSKFDTGEVAGEDVVEYWVYRDREPVGQLIAVEPVQKGERKTGSLNTPLEVSGAEPAVWDVVGTVEADGDSIYQWNAPTICDSTIALGMCLTGYYVSARAYNGSDHYDSNAKRGYSVDNLAPGPPQNVTAAYNTGSGNHLTWDRPSDPDVA
ncbi:MAG: hypothetical protein P8181_14140, partial [bacterium]